MEVSLVVHVLTFEHTSHVCNGCFWHGLALLLMLLTLTAKQATVRQDDDSSSDTEACVLEA